MKVVTKELVLNGRTLSLEVGRYAPQADAAVLARLGDTMVLATIVTAPLKEDLGYFPLSVDYIERLYAGGRIKGSRWVKREGRASDEAVLTGRLVDRSIRPLFPKDYKGEVQLALTVLSVDLENDPAVLALVASSAAIAISSIPWNGPIGGMRVGLKDGQFIGNPTATEMQTSELDLVVASSRDRVVMIESGAKEVPESQVLAGILFAKAESQKIIDLITDLQKEVGKTKTKIEPHELDKTIAAKAEKYVTSEMDRIFAEQKGKEAAGSGFDTIKATFLADYEPEVKKEADSAFEYYWKKTFRAKVLAGERIDGRSVTEVRPIECEVGLLPRTHGSAMFKRGWSQALTVATLGAPSLSQLIESATGEENKKYIHHYSMPPYSTGETGRVGTPNRREIGHGALAERALEPVIPTQDNFPYTIRVVSEIMSSNGSTSMASTCGSTLALMDAGVPITAPVAGIAMGLVTGETYGEKGDFLVLTDLMGIEDFNGDMDFKITGTKKGITAIQMDTKIPGLTDAIIEKTFTQALVGRLSILENMQTVISAPRPKISQYAPKIVVLHIPQEKIGEVIGPGGRVIRKLIEETGCNIEVEDDGSINISGLDEAGVAAASAKVNGLTQDAIVGEIYEGEVKRLEPFGAFVEILPGKEGLVHVSQMGEGFVTDPSQVVSLGQRVSVRLVEIDDRGRLNLTMKLTLNSPTGDGDNSTTAAPQNGFRPRPAYGNGPGNRFGNRPSGPPRFRR